MEREFILKLDEIRKELDISLEDYITIVNLALLHRNKSKINISDEMLYEIIVEALVGYDYANDDNESQIIDDLKNFNPEKEKLHTVNKVLFSSIEEYLNELDNRQRTMKTPEETVNRAIKTLDF